MPSVDHSSRVDEFYAAFAAGSAAQLAPAVTSDFRLYIPDMQNLPLQPVYHGLAGFAQLLRDREGTIDYTLFDQYERIVSGDLVVQLGRTEGRATKEDRPFSHNWAHVFRFAEGR